MTFSPDTIDSLQQGREWAIKQADNKAARLEQLTAEAADCTAARRGYLAQVRDFTEILRGIDPAGDYQWETALPVVGGSELVGAIKNLAKLLGTAGLPAELNRTPRIELQIDVENAWAAQAILAALEASGGTWHIDTPYVGTGAAWQYGRTYGDVLDFELKLRWIIQPVDGDQAPAAPAEVPA
jgi:hypothetical protein